jgi:hypothetical protein
LRRKSDWDLLCVFWKGRICDGMGDIEGGRRESRIGTVDGCIHDLISLRAPWYLLGKPGCWSARRLDSYASTTGTSFHFFSTGNDISRSRELRWSELRPRFWPRHIYESTTHLLVTTDPAEDSHRGDDILGCSPAYSGESDTRMASPGMMIARGDEEVVY